MDWKIFLPVLAAGIGFVVLQGILSWFDGYLSQAQLRDRNITNAWSFWEHGGMWADVGIISPIVAYALSKYELDTSWWGVALIAISAAIVFAMMQMYKRNGIVMGDHCTHHGVTTGAGQIHGLFAVMAIWVCLQIYLGVTTPVVSKVDIIIFSILLTPFFYLGVAKFSKRWIFSTQDKWQVAAMTLVVWIAALVRLAQP